jgi:hypothetical protein
MGESGIGKTTICARSPSPIIDCSEDGLIGEGFKSANHHSPKDWNEQLEFVTWLYNTNHNYKTFALDTIDWMEPDLFRYVCGRDGKGNIEEYGYGKGYEVALDEYRRFVNILDKLNVQKNMNIIITAHTQIKSFNNPIGDNYDRYEMKTSKKIASFTSEWADCMFFAKNETFTNKDSKKGKAKAVSTDRRIVYTRRNAAYDAKNRYGLPETMPLDINIIMDRISKINTEDTGNLIEQIKDLSNQLPAETKKSILDYTEANKSNIISLRTALNRVLTLIEEKKE